MNSKFLYIYRLNSLKKPLNSARKELFNGFPAVSDDDYNLDDGRLCSVLWRLKKCLSSFDHNMFHIDRHIFFADRKRTERAFDQRKKAINMKKVMIKMKKDKKT